MDNQGRNVLERVEGGWDRGGQGGRRRGKKEREEEKNRKERGGGRDKPLRVRGVKPCRVTTGGGDRRPHCGHEIPVAVRRCTYIHIYPQLTNSA